MAHGTMAATDVGRGSPVSPVRWLRAVARGRRDGAADGVRCSWQLGYADPRRRSAAAGRPGAPDRHPRQGQARRSTARMGGRTSARAAASRSPRWRPTPTRPASRRWRTPTAIWPGRRWRASGWSRATTAPTAARPSRRTATSRPPIRGVRLDGTDGNLEIADTDGGALDGDPTIDRAMGPMQFIPETWRLYGVDANNDGVVEPGQHRRRGAVGGRLSVLARQGPGHAARLDGRAARLQPVRPVRAHGAGLGDGLRSEVTRSDAARKARRELGGGTHSRLSPFTSPSGQAHHARRRQCPSSSRSEPARSSTPGATRRSRSRWP